MNVQEMSGGSPPRLLSWRTVVWAVVGAFYFLVPAQPMPLNTLDGSWTYGISHALTHGFKFGTDLVFTMGPLGALFTGMYDPAIQPGWIVFQFLFAGGLALLWSDGCREQPARWRVIVLCLILPFAVRGDRQFLLFFSTALLVCVWRPGTLTSLVVVGVGLGLSSLCKFTFVLAAFVVVVGIALRGLLTSRRLDMVAPAAFLLTAAIGWAVLGYSPTQIGSYVLTSLEISRGYALAMGTWGPGKEIALFWLVALLATFFLLRSWSEQATAIRGQLLRVLAVAATLGFFFLVHKASFTRHDGHALIGAATIGSFVALSLAFFSTRPRVDLVGMAVASAACVVTTFGHYDEQYWPQLTAPWRQVGMQIRGVPSSADSWAASLAKIRAESSLPVIAGSVDIYSYNQSALIAHDFNWRPRPVFQSYAAYTARLANLNARHLEQNGAETIFWAFQPIDSRLPSLEDGPSLLSLMQWYRPRQTVGIWLHLERGLEPREVRLLNHEPKKLMLGEEWVLPRHNAAPVWLRAKAAQSALCRLEAVLAPPPPIQLVAKLNNGEVREFHFVPSMAEAGFLASPLLESGSRLEDFFSSEWRSLLADREVTSLMLAGGPATHRCYRDGFDFDVSSLQWSPPIALEIDQIADDSLSVPTQTNEAKVELLDKGYAILALGNDPIAVLGSLQPVADHCQRTLYVDLEVPESDEAMVFWRSGELPFSASNSARFPISRRATIALALTNTALTQEIRLDPGTHPGRFVVHQAHVITKSKNPAGGERKPCN